jgi:hypothetical protein
LEIGILGIIKLHLFRYVTDTITCIYSCRAHVSLQKEIDTHLIISGITITFCYFSHFMKAF